MDGFGVSGRSNELVNRHRIRAVMLLWLGALLHGVWMAPTPLFPTSLCHCVAPQPNVLRCSGEASLPCSLGGGIDDLIGSLPSHGRLCIRTRMFVRGEVLTGFRRMWYIHRVKPPHAVVVLCPFLHMFRAGYASIAACSTEWYWLRCFAKAPGSPCGRSVWVVVLPTLLFFERHAWSTALQSGGLVWFPSSLH